MIDAKLDSLRHAIDEADHELIAILLRRMQISREIGVFKKERHLPALDADRWHKVLAKQVAEGEKHGLSPEFIEKLYALIHQESVATQEVI